jgi:2-methylcitrate dehydratase PrpD
LAAELAQRGLVGSREIVEGRYGIFRDYVRTEHPDWRVLLDGLGERFPMLDMPGFKVWPACGYTRPTNAATLELRREHRIASEDVETTTICAGTGATQLLCEPLDLKRRPKLGIDGKYSIPFTTAVMMVKGNVTLRDYTEDGLRDPAVLAMADRVSYRADPNPALPRGGNSTVSRPTVEIRLKDGRVLSRQVVEGVPGDPSRPVTRDALEAKFRDCVSFAAVPLAPGNIDDASSSSAISTASPMSPKIAQLLTPEPAE